MKRFKNLREKLALDQCRKDIAPVGSDIYYALRFTPKDHHPEIIGLLKFYNDIFNLFFYAKEDSVTQAQFQWWGNELTCLHQKKSGHPTLQVLAALSNTPSFTNHLLKLLNAIADHFENFSFAHFEDLCAHLKKTIGLRELIIQDLLGNEQHETTIDLSVSLGLCDMIQNFYFYTRRSFIPIAQSDIAELQLESIFTGLDKTSDNLKVLLKKYHADAELLFSKAIPTPTLKNLIIRNKLALASVEAIAADDYCILEHQTKITPLKKLAIAWRG
jgi:phytoene synthase